MSVPAAVTPMRRAGRQRAKPRDVPDDAVSVRLPQMCQMLCVGTTKANELIRTGRVKSVLIGKTRLISVASIKALIEGQAA